MAVYIPFQAVIATGATETVYVPVPVKGKVKSFFGAANTTMSSGKTVTLYGSSDTSAAMVATYATATSAAGTAVSGTDQSITESKYTFTKGDMIKVTISSATVAGDFLGSITLDEFNLPD